MGCIIFSLQDELLFHFQVSTNFERGRGQLTIESLKVSYRDVRSGELGGKGGHWYSGDMTVPPLKSVINHFFN